MVKRIVLTADDGMVLTNGLTSGTAIFLAVGADASAFREITEEEHKAMQLEGEL